MAEGTVAFPAIALFLTAMGVTVTVVSAVAIVVWRFSALTSKLESLTAKLDEVVTDIKASRAKLDYNTTQTALLELRIDGVMKTQEELSNRLARIEHMS